MATAHPEPGSLGGPEKHLAGDVPGPSATFTGDDSALTDPLPCASLILDLCDVVPFYSGSGLKLSIPAGQFRHILDSPDWLAHEYGQMGMDECFARLAPKFGEGMAAIAEMVRLPSGTLTFNEPLLALVRQLRAAGGRRKAYLASKMTAADWALLRPTLAGWALTSPTLACVRMPPWSCAPSGAPL